MSKPIKQTSQAGFTLVELAIVMIIIGLLIAGVLKGQELIGNARVTATVAQIKGIDAATSTFKDTYASLPGDLIAPATRLPNCAGLCAPAAPNGDGKLSTTFAAAPGAEAQAFFPQLGSADLLTGIVLANGAVFGGIYPAAKLDGNGIIPASVVTPAADMPGAVATNGTPSGLYLAILGTVPAAAVAATAANEGMSPSAAGRIDTKLDDGIAGTGSTIGIGSAGAALGNCGLAVGAYATIDPSNKCGIYTRIQG
jgi:prepilin-type N-terminal cleavage/methylation domain-containing protein